MKQNVTYELFTSLDITLEEAPCILPDVQIVRDEGGEPLAYLCTRQFGKKEREASLPIEFFNHELMEVDASSETEVANFMAKYGCFVGWHHAGRAVPFWIDFQIEDLDVTSIESIEAYENDHNYFSSTTFNIFNKDPNKIPYYTSLKPQLLKIQKSIEKHNEKHSHDRIFFLSLISYEQLKKIITDWQLTSKIVNATVMFNKVEDLAKYLDQPEQQIIGGCESYLKAICNHLKQFRPDLSFIEIFDETDVGKFTTPNALMIETAISIQMWNFLIESRAGYSTCKECGKPYIRKSTKAKSSARSSSKFCCDKCKNRNAQRKYRQSEGYKLKQRKKAHYKC